MELHSTGDRPYQMHSQLLKIPCLVWMGGALAEHAGRGGGLIHNNCCYCININPLHLKVHVISRQTWKATYRQEEETAKQLLFVQHYQHTHSLNASCLHGDLLYP